MPSIRVGSVGQRTPHKNNSNIHSQQTEAMPDMLGFVGQRTPYKNKRNIYSISLVQSIVPSYLKGSHKSGDIYTRIYLSPVTATSCSVDIAMQTKE